MGSLYFAGNFFFVKDCFLLVCAIVESNIIVEFDGKYQYVFFFVLFLCMAYCNKIITENITFLCLVYFLFDTFQQTENTKTNQNQNQNNLLIQKEMHFAENDCCFVMSGN
jgi:hypothetical protein